MAKDFKFIFINGIYDTSADAEFNIIYNISAVVKDDEIIINILQTVYEFNKLADFNKYCMTLAINKEIDLILKNVMDSKIIQEILFYKILTDFNSKNILTFDVISYKFY